MMDRGNLLKSDWDTYSRYDSQNYHLGQNDYSFDALQTYCFGINIKL